MFHYTRSHPFFLIFFVIFSQEPNFYENFDKN